MSKTREIVLSTLAFPTANNPADLFAVGSEDLDIDLEALRIVGKEIGLGTWFNAAPVGWWLRLFGSGTLTLRINGYGHLKVWGAVNGKRFLVADGQVAGEWAHDFDLESKFEFLWVELCDRESATLQSMEWSLSSTRIHSSSTPAKVTVVVPTFGLEQEALKQVGRLLAPSLSDVVARVFVIDQGHTVADCPQYPDVASRFGARFELIQQENYGGSGGYARGMIESLRFPDDAVLLLDDDAVIEVESLRRALVISEALGRNTIIGTGLISAELPTQLASLAEGIQRRNFNWGPSDGVGDGQELTNTTPENWIFLDSNAPVEYSGWWGTLLPVGAVHRIGFPAPFFLKWDDAEYGLRASKKGIQTTTIPGISTWHPTWAAKGTVSSWSSWPMHRNRLTVAAAYGASKGVIWDSLIHQIKHILSLQYASAELWNQAIVQFMDNPDWLTTNLIKTRVISQAFLDGLPKIRPDLTFEENSQPKHIFVQTARGIAGIFRPAKIAQSGHCKGIDYNWSKSLGMDGYAITRNGAVEALVRDPRRARSILRRTIIEHFRLMREWKVLQQEYSKALPESTNSWKETLQLR